MRISEHWLQEWVAVPDDTAVLAEQLTMAGLEVDSVELAAPVFTDVVIAEVIECEPHPDAERLKVCRVDDGSGEIKTVVCGAPNAAAGLKAPFAQVGATLPDGLKIKAAKLRGVKSFGMLCSGRELGLSEDSAGLLALPRHAPVGENFRDWLDLDDSVIEIELTPNRSDCFSMVGVAREVSVLSGQTLPTPSVAAVSSAIKDTRNVTLHAAEACPRYCARVIHEIDAAAPTPMWLQERLRRAGIRPLSIAVDITNYVMLELGQPMHAFDLNKVSGNITVRQALGDESLTLLNGDSVSLDSNTLVIADDNAAIAMAGVMGGEATAVSDTTSSVLLESAFFTPSAMAGRARQYGLHTDASHRFERGVDPALTVTAIERASGLFVEYAGGQVGPITEACEADKMPQRMPVNLRPARVNQLLGTAIDQATMRTILTQLGMPPHESKRDWQVTPPSWRFDIAREVDLIEEIARVYGYNQLPTRHASAPAAIPVESEQRISMHRLRALLVDRGYQEAVSYSFVSARLQEQLDPEHTPLALTNPLSADLSVMRTTLWSGLVRALAYNRNRQIKRVRLFETGLRFRGELAELEQTPVIAGIAAGPMEDERWANATDNVDFFAVKGDVEGLLSLAGSVQALRFIPATHPALHPGQSAQIELAGQRIGWLGALHPRVLRSLELEGPVYVFEVKRSVFEHKAVPVFDDVSRYPSVRRDLALVLAESISAQAVEDCVVESAGDALEHLELFDVYRGKGVKDGCKSLAIGLILQDKTRTLTDEEVGAIQQRVVAKLRAALGAELRE
ncbi:MAG: phenylalanine--tRNA ligase subunit beta [Spiribacter sp.]|jgi:phenylalanyl-tRNA synthetase beta chain|nr:phenylalanine--tRNA ligase subunit beta [Spiribacter sp.]MDR9490215.1 phenylalanine--tRNA ligase subunit beta [Spiribacter sp.]